MEKTEFAAWIALVAVFMLTLISLMIATGDDE